MELFNWTSQLEQLKYTPERLEQVATAFHSQLVKEVDALTHDPEYKVSEFCKVCPQLNSRIDKDTGIAKLIAELFLPSLEDSNLRSKRYQKSIGRLLKQFYIQAHSTQQSSWKKMLQDLADKPSPTEKDVDYVVDSFARQLEIERQLLEKELDKDETPISNQTSFTSCGRDAPRLRSHFDKRFRIAKKIALKLWPIDLESEKSEKVASTYSNIRYHRLIHQLSERYLSKEEAERIRKLNFKTVRHNRQGQLFCTLKQRPTSHLVTDPVPMPVTVAPKDELEPVFDFLRRGEAIDQDHLSFPKCTFFRDGRIDVCKQVVGSPHIGSLMDSLKENSHVSDFLMGNNIVTDHGAKVIAEFIENPHLPKIRTWYLAGNEITEKGMERLSKALSQDSDCQSLWLKRNPIKSEGARHIGILLSQNKTIKVLDLHNTGLGDEGVAYIFSSLKQNHNLRILYLDANDITPNGIEPIIDYFQQLVNEDRRGLTSLYLSLNRLDDSGAVRLAETLKLYPHLKRLCLSSNAIGKEGGEAIFNCLKDHPRLEMLDVGLYKSTADLELLPNNLGNETVDSIVKFIKANKKVKVLSILHNNISQEGLEKVVQVIEESNHHLLYIYYTQYGEEISKELHQRFKKVMERNIKENLDLTLEEFVKRELRHLKHGRLIDRIDSIYRGKM